MRDPAGVSKCVGASASRRRCMSKGSSAFRAASRSSGVIAARLVLPSIKGASQFAALSSQRPVSERSGQQSSGSERRNKATRSRHCASVFVNGSRAIPPPPASSAAMPAASARADSGPAGTGRFCSLRTSAPSRRLRRPRSAARSLSKLTSSCVAIASRAMLSRSASLSAAAAMMRAAPARPAISAMAR